MKSKVRSSSQSRGEGVERREKRKEPQIVDLRAAGDRKSKSTAGLSSRGVLPDKNPVKLKQLRQNGLSTSRSSFDEPSRSSSTVRKPAVPKAKAESSKSGSGDKAKSSVRKSTKEKTTQPQYNEKRGESSLYVPKDSASKLNDMMKSDAKRSKERTSVSRASEKLSTSKSLEKALMSRRSEKAQSKSVEKSSSSKKLEKVSTSKHSDKASTSINSSQKPLPRRASRERKRSRTLSPSEVKVLHSNSDDNAKSKSNETEEQAAKVENDEYQYEDDFEVCCAFKFLVNARNII